MITFRNSANAWVALCLLGFASGCATNKIDWAARVGNYSFDQAVVEFGPPDKDAKLTDGTVVAEWLMRRGYRQVVATGGYYHHSPWHHDPYPATYLETGSPDYYLRLTFGAGGTLKSWKNLTK